MGTDPSATATSPSSRTWTCWFGLTVLIGPNACGKSTLLRGMARLTTGRDAVPHGPTAPDGLTVGDVDRLAVELAARGRQPYQRWWGIRSQDDDRAITSAVLGAGIQHLVDVDVESLSDGQRQRAWIAMALAQETGMLLLDEPTTYLDVTDQVEVLDLLTALVRDGGRTVVACSTMSTRPRGTPTTSSRCARTDRRARSTARRDRRGDRCRRVRPAEHGHRLPGHPMSAGGAGGQGARTLNPVTEREERQCAGT